MSRQVTALVFLCCSAPQMELDAGRGKRGASVGSRTTGAESRHSSRRPRRMRRGWQAPDPPGVRVGKRAWRAAQHNARIVLGAPRAQPGRADAKQAGGRRGAAPGRQSTEHQRVFRDRQRQLLTIDAVGADDVAVILDERAQGVKIGRSLGDVLIHRRWGGRAATVRGLGDGVEVSIYGHGVSRFLALAKNPAGASVHAFSRFAPLLRVALNEIRRMRNQRLFYGRTYRKGAFGLADLDPLDTAQREVRTVLAEHLRGTGVLREHEHTVAHLVLDALLPPRRLKEQVVFELDGASVTYSVDVSQTEEVTIHSQWSGSVERVQEAANDMLREWVH